VTSECHSLTCVTASPKVSADIAKYFEENPNENVFAGEIDVDGDRNVSGHRHC
jgi:hypothetical protein